MICVLLAYWSPGMSKAGVVFSLKMFYSCGRAPKVKVTSKLGSSPKSAQKYGDKSMKSLIKMMMICATLCFAAHSPQAFAEDHAGADEAVAMVQKVIAKIKASGKDAVIAEINQFNPEYKDRDLYVTIMDMNGLELAHGANKRMQGVNLYDLKDTDGKYYIRERLDIVKAKGKGWQDYNFVNPVSKIIEPKSMYFERFQDIVICAGVYKKK
jgi:hypothetical protein